MEPEVQTVASHAQPSRQQEILGWYDKLPRRSFSQLLGVAPNTDTQTDRTEFRALLKRFHPDALSPAAADVSDEAQTVLMHGNAEESIAADAQAAEGQLPVAPRPPPAAPPSPEVTQSPPNARAQAAVESEPRGQRVQNAIESAQAYMGRKDIDAAVAVLYEVIQLADDGQRGEIRTLLATAYVADPKRRRDALTLLSDILRDEPSNAEALTLLGTLYLREGLLARAESTLVRAVAAAPGHTQALAKLLAVRASLHERSAPETRQPRGGGLRARLPWMAR